MLYIIYRVHTESSDKKNGFVRVWQNVRHFFRRFGKKKSTNTSSETKDNADEKQAESNEEFEEIKARVIPCIDD